MSLVSILEKASVQDIVPMSTAGKIEDKSIFRVYFSSQVQGYLFIAISFVLCYSIPQADSDTMKES